MPCPRRAGSYRSCGTWRVPAALLDPGTPSQPRPLWHEPVHRHEDCRAAAGEPSSASERGGVLDAYYLLAVEIAIVRARCRVSQSDAASAVVMVTRDALELRTSINRLLIRKSRLRSQTAQQDFYSWQGSLRCWLHVARSLRRTSGVMLRGLRASSAEPTTVTTAPKCSSTAIPPATPRRADC
jgi:hypothetical protein